MISDHVKMRHGAGENPGISDADQVFYHPIDKHNDQEERL